jgi:ferritin-like metal-binding protein YciE
MHHPRAGDARVWKALMKSEDLPGKDVPPVAWDAGVIASAERAEHYELAACGMVRAIAPRRGYEDQARLLNQTTQEEVEGDKHLTRLADSYINGGAKTARHRAKTARYSANTPGRGISGKVWKVRRID